MHNRFNRVQAGASVPSETDAVAALVSALAGGGISRSKIDAIISKTARPIGAAGSLPGSGARGDAAGWNVSARAVPKSSQR